MDAKDADPADEWPLPPAWMWGCRECVALYQAMKRALEIVEAVRRQYGPGIDHDPMDSVISSQLRLAEHIVSRHAANVPGPDSGCARCASDAVDTRMASS